MMNKIIYFITIFYLFAQPNNDARMIGLNGSYTTLARGYHCIGINPANLNVYKDNSINIINFALGLSTNSLSLSNYNAINAANFEDTTSINYYPKSSFYNTFNGKGVRLLQNYNFPLSLFNISIKNFAFTTSFNNYVDLGIPNGLIELLLYGNPINKNISTDMEQFISTTQNFGVSYAHDFDNISLGFTLKYILGLFYMGMESIEEPSIITEITGFTGQSKYLIQQAIGGSGIGLDLGLSTKKTKEGYQFGLSIINLLGLVEWTQDHFMRSRLESNISNATGDYYLRPNEFLYFNMVMDSVTGLSFSNTLDEPMIYYEMYKVVPVKDIDLISIDDADTSFVVQFGNDYLLPSGGIYKLKDLIGDGDKELDNFSNYTEFSNSGGSQFVTRQPMYLRFGVSKTWEQNIIIAADLVTGFSDRFGASSVWRLSIGSEIIRFKNKLIRFGYAFGGVSKKSMSVGYGTRFGNIMCDIGIAFNGGFSIETAKGIDLALGLTWNKKNGN